MKLIFVITHLISLGGAGKVLMEYANKFAENGHGVTIVAQKINRKNYKFNEKIVLVEVGGPLPSNPFYWINFANIKKKYLKILNRLDCDLLISMLFPTNYFCSKVNKKNYLKILYYCFEPYRLFHDIEFINSAPNLLKFYSVILRLLFKKKDIEGAKASDEIVSISKFIRKKVEEAYGKRSLIHYIGVPNNYSFDIVYKRKLNYKTHQKYPSLFTLGLTHHMKGVKELFIIFKKVLKHKPNITLKIGGWISKYNKNVIKNMIKKLNLRRNKIVFLGNIPTQRLEKYYTESSLTIYTAFYESFGLIPVESMINGTPVIAFNNAGPSETIIDGKTGYLINKFDLNQFAHKVLKVIDNEELYLKLSKNGIYHAKMNFDLNQSYKKLENLLKNVID